MITTGTKGYVQISPLEWVAVTVTDVSMLWGVYVLADDFERHFVTVNGREMAVWIAPAEFKLERPDTSLGMTKPIIIIYE